MEEPDPTPRPLDHLALRGKPDAPALVTRDGTIDYAALEDMIGRAAAALEAYGLAPGARVASWLPKGIVTALLPLACARAGLVHVPINPLLKRLQVTHILADSDASLLVTLRVGVATEVVTPLEHEHLQAKLVGAALGDGEAEEAGADDDEVGL